jgi:hypothetical protein
MFTLACVLLLCGVLYIYIYIYIYIFLWFIVVFSSAVIYSYRI